MSEREKSIKKARIYFSHKWPEQLESGIMFFEGERITRDEFINEQCPPHDWSQSGEKCCKCGTKDWMT